MFCSTSTTACTAVVFWIVLIKFLEFMYVFAILACRCSLLATAPLRDLTSGLVDKVSAAAST